MEINPTEYLKPRIVDVDIVSPQRAKVVLEPMERGFGFTLGNSIRRVLLSSIPGFAITQVKIDGVVHEYSTLDGVQEDVVDVLLNIKKIALKMHDTNEATITLNKNEEGPAKKESWAFSAVVQLEDLAPKYLSPFFYSIDCWPHL